MEDTEGEQPLLPYEACNLGSINLTKFLKSDSTGHASIDMNRLKDCVTDAVRFLDDVIDINHYPIPEIDKMTRSTRKIGLGVMGFADILLDMGVPYDCSDACEFADSLMRLIDDAAKSASVELADERGVYPAYWDGGGDISMTIRNATRTTIAPTGTLSIIAGVSSGVEPIFAYAYTRNVMDKANLVEVNPRLKKTLQNHGIYSEELMKKIVEQGSLAHIDEIPDSIKQIYVCAHDITPYYHIKMQAAFQKHTDNAVSKTVNFTNSATKQDVADVYKLAWKLGCKGTTIYRDGSRDEQVLNIAGPKKEELKSSETKEDVLPDHIEAMMNSGCDSTACMLRNTPVQPRERPAITRGITEKVKIGCGNLYVTVNYDNQGICEIFTNTGKAGGCPSQSEATARLMSVALRAGVNIDDLIQQLKGIRCPSTIRQPGMKVTSCPDAIAKTIEKVLKSKEFIDYATDQQDSVEYVDKVESVSSEVHKEATSDAVCPECGAPVEHEGGCMICQSCGYSKCG